LQIEPRGGKTVCEEALSRKKWISGPAKDFLWQTLGKEKKER